MVERIDGGCRVGPIRQTLVGGPWDGEVVTTPAAVLELLMRRGDEVHVYSVDDQLGLRASYAHGGRREFVALDYRGTTLFPRVG
jgi:hypothetical protein